MKAVLSERPGPADLLKVAEIETPVVADDGVLVQVHAASVNPVDLFSLTPVHHFMRRVAARSKPRPDVIGHDFAGTVTAVGAAVTVFHVGDDVFGAHKGAFAEYVAMPESAGVVCKPAGSGFEEAAAVPVAALTALQAVRDHGPIPCRAACRFSAFCTHRTAATAGQGSSTSIIPFRIRVGICGSAGGRLSTP